MSGGYYNMGLPPGPGPDGSGPEPRLVRAAVIVPIRIFMPVRARSGVTGGGAADAVAIRGPIR
jgi:hypothetical protein